MLSRLLLAKVETMQQQLSDAHKKAERFKVLSVFVY